MRDPKVYLFDEPFAHLDKKGHDCFKAKLASLKSTATVIIATNDREQLKSCDEIVFLSQGSVVDIGTPEKILPMFSRSS